MAEFEEKRNLICEKIRTEFDAGCCNGDVGSQAPYKNRNRNYTVQSLFNAVENAVIDASKMHIARSTGDEREDFEEELSQKKETSREEQLHARLK